MNIEHFENILKHQGFEFQYYELIFDVLSAEDKKISEKDRLQLLSVIQNENFYHYSYHWHAPDLDNKGLLDNLKSLDKFHINNAPIHSNKDYQDFLNHNLFPILEGESKNYFEKGTMNYKTYDDFNEKEHDVVIKFFSPLSFYNVLQSNQLFSNILEKNIINKLLNIETNYLKTENPIIKEGIVLIDTALKNPEKFSDVLDFCAKYKKILLPSNNVESDLHILSTNYPDLVDSYCNYISKPGINYEFEKSIFSKKMTEFYFKHFEKFISHEGKIPNPLVWIYESRNFLSTHKYIQNIEQQHFEYFKNLNHSSFFQSFVTQVLFSQRFNHEISVNNVKDMLSKNFNFENLFKHVEIHNPTSTELTNFENYMLELSDSMKCPDLLPFYRSKKIEHKLISKNNYIKPRKI